jgi:hypothetical protein
MDLQDMMRGRVFYIVQEISELKDNITHNHIYLEITPLTLRSTINGKNILCSRVTQN